MGVPQSPAPAPSGARFDSFGSSVAISGDTVIVGAPRDLLGSAYVFLEPPSGWAGPRTENGKLTASRDLASSGGFGHSVAISGDTVVVNEAPAGDEDVAYVFVKPPGGWAGALTENVQLNASPFAVGLSVAVSGNTVVVGLSLHLVGANLFQGSASVFELFEAEPTATQVRCKTSGCRVPVICNLAPALGSWSEWC